jgi:2,4-dienoyl-CoA reductase-like NADH-dependent reductase (Old Yellow Enzyme family)
VSWPTPAHTCSPGSDRQPEKRTSSIRKAEYPDAVDRAGILVLRALQSWQPVRQLIRSVRRLEVAFAIRLSCGVLRGKLIVAGGFDQDTAAEWLRLGRADLVAFGRKFLANPDLPERFRLCAPLNADDRFTYYGGGAKGYTDYPTLAQERGQEPQPCVDDRWR